ncbi:uncharacterized protein MYCGRDRAFT_90989 [Zymoseptoria tritici IPO323]|uniref:Uncharacterized protein n=1 Tax=Zymoseptoria tritici (strain CBS 115943 / IPO323) TaxID=336722 RepID=F9X3X3_ZYMTI|nr:uncharacterized protein MYCGRDRAFT_90989 [Zymoseptoria tritici IPO323]EGP90385.1 hypothetical protein MYCGRDRAFT_90989 [Zymoseptoria tritici IPO323]
MRVSIIAYALRALGLEFINSLHRQWSGRGRVERPKIILHKSLRVALSRSLVHLLPLTIFTALVYINYRTLYIGYSFSWQGQQNDALYSTMIQIAAKAQELLCVASLAAIVLQALRSELLHDGLPIGLLGSGIWFSQVSSFWSPEFLAAGSWSITSARRIRLYLLLVLAGLIAVVIGPASAVLMLPRNQEIPAGGTSFYQNGVPDEIWPTAVISTAEPAVCALTNSTEYPICPSGGYKSIVHTLQALDPNQTTFCAPEEPSLGQQFAPQCQAKGITGWRYWNNFLVQSSQHLLPPVLSTFTSFNRPGNTVVIQPHVATVASMQRIVRTWSGNAGASTRSPWNQYKWSYGLVASGSSTNPWVRVQCSEGQNISADASEIGFPYLQPFSEFLLGRPGTSFGPGHRYSSISQLDCSKTDRIRAQWIPLALDEFGDSETGTHSTGLLIELPWVGMEFTWHPPGLVESVESAETNRPIRLDQSWLRLLTPQLSSSGSNFTSGMNTMEDLLTRMRISDVVGDLRTRPSMYHDGGRCVYGMRPSSKTDTQLWNANDCQVATVGKHLQMIVGTLVADGLSRFGSHRVFENVDLPLRNWSLRVPRTFNSSRLLHDLPQSTADLASQWLSISVTGWVYYASETSDYLALAVVCIYMLLATTHVLWLLCPTHWISSDAWDNLTELLVLCKNSPPSVPSRLENASAGIYRLNTFATIVKVRVVDESENTEGPGLVEKVGNMDSKRVVLVEQSPIKSQDELELALIGATTCATAVAPSAQSNLRKRTGVLEVVKIDARYG